MGGWVELVGWLCWLVGERIDVGEHLGGLVEWVGWWVGFGLVFKQMAVSLSVCFNRR